MASLNATFDATQIDPQTPFEVIPPGKYKVQIVASDMRPTKSGDGQMLWLEMEILEGEQQGRKLWDRLNLVNPNQQAVEIAQRTLSAICHATGQLSVADSEQLHFRPMLATVRVRPSREVNGKTYEQSNEVRGYEPAGNVAAMPARGAQPTQQRSAPAGNPAMANAPWKRKAG